ncbi:transcriptional regulator [Streptomyces sp. TRM64462]|uniref:helix-turn-helix transcriptional regulator n=1 Tax=Streptomyces sp. TRM64462 TaxID=2741726 RepID=UPI0020C7D6E6|nr:PAS domain-containing protein [Streptomyces sp. TRM64462]
MVSVEEDAGDPRVRMWGPVCRAVASLLGPYAEVVLHAPETDRVLAVWNPMSSRRPGDPSLLGELDALEPAGRDVFGPYEKVLADGRRLSSVSAVLRDADGAASAVLCVNLDRTPLERAAAVLSAFGAPAVARPEPLFEEDWSERVQHIVGGYVRECGRPVERLTRADRLTVLARLEEAGIFAVRRATPVVAAALRVSRSTLYGLLAELRAAAAPNAKDRTS